VEALLDSTVLFTLVLALAFVIERFLEVLKSAYDLLDSRRNWYHFWTRQTIKFRDRLERQMHIFEYVDPKSVRSVLIKFRGMFLNEQITTPSTVPVLSGDLVRAFSVKIACKLIGISIGIALAFYFKIDMLDIWIKSSGKAMWVQKFTTPQFNFIMTGIATGLGAGPVHKIITKIEKQQKRRKQRGGSL